MTVIALKKDLNDEARRRSTLALRMQDNDADHAQEIDDCECQSWQVAGHAGRPGIMGKSGRMWLLRPALSRPSLPKREGGQILLICIDHEDGKELGGFLVAAIVADAVTVARYFGEISAGLVFPDRTVIDLAEDRSFRHRGMDEGIFRMRVRVRIITRPLFDENAFEALARHIRQWMLINKGDLGCRTARCIVRAGATSGEHCDHHRGKRLSDHDVLPFKTGHLCGGVANHWRGYEYKGVYEPQ